MTFPGPCPEQFNLTGYVLSAGRATPSKIALAMIGRSRAERWSYARLEAAILGTATGLLDAGLRPGDRVMLRIGNEVAFPITYLAAIAVGIIPVPTPVSLTAIEVEKLAAALRPACVLASPGISLPKGIDVIGTDTLARFRDLPPATPVPGDPNRPAYIVPTSGTSGQPRLVVHAHRAIWARRYMWDGWYGLRDSDRMAHAGAFNWTYTLGTGLLDPWATGATALIPTPDLTPADLPILLKRHEATIFAAAPGIYRQMLRGYPALDLPKLRHGLTAGEKCPDALREAWQIATGTDLHEAFGQSECSTFISGNPQRPAPTGTLGYPQTGRKIAIVDEDGAPLPAETPGNIAIDRHDPGLMLHLWEDPEGTTARVRENWYLTGDTGEATPDGAIRYLGRQDDMLNAGGFRVSPLEVEAALCAHPDVSEAAVVDLEVKPGTFVITAFIVAGDVSDEELNAHAAQNLAPFKRPRMFKRSDALPRNANGKLLRRALRQA